MAQEINPVSACTDWLTNRISPLLSFDSDGKFIVNQIRTCFACDPSPYFHIGAARLALFNWMYAKKKNGKFVLRIDDIDTPNSSRSILDGLTWLGIDPDEIHYQSDNLKRYKEIAYFLVQNGNAYPCLEKPKDRKVFRGKDRNQSSITNMSILQDEVIDIRLRVPEGDILDFEDIVQGTRQWDSDHVSDPLLLRADGTPTPTFATAVDDIHYKITHIIRSDKNYHNVGVQLLIYKALEESIPQFAHFPYLTEKITSRTLCGLISPEEIERLKDLKIEKPTTSLDVIEYYHQLGYPPEAIATYLVRLGWTLDDKTRVLSLEEVSSKWKLRHVSKLGTTVEKAHIHRASRQHMERQSLEERAKGCLPYLQRMNILPKIMPLEMLSKYMEVVEKCPIKCYADIVECAFFFQDPIYYGDVFGGMREIVKTLLFILRRLEMWNGETLRREVNSLCPEKNGELLSVLRAVLCGQNKTEMCVYDIMAILGKDETTKRIDAGMKSRTTKAGDTAICVRAEGLHLTEGKEYLIDGTSDKDNFLFLTNDLHNNTCYHAHLFMIKD